MDCVPGVVAASRTSTVQDGCVRLLDALYRAHTDSGETGHIRKNSSLYEPLDPYTWNYSEFPYFYSAYKRPYLRYWRGLMSHFHILCSPIPDLQNGIGFVLLSRGETKRTKKERDPFYGTRSNRARSTPALGQAVSSYSLKRGVYLVQI